MPVPKKETEGKNKENLGMGGGGYSNFLLLMIWCI